MVLLALLLLGATIGTALEYTDEDRARFPKLFYLDDYKRCLAKPDGVYCLGTFDLTPAKLPHPTYELMQAYSDEAFRHFNRTRIHRGYCISARCPTRGFDDASLHFEHNASLHFDHNNSLRFQRCADRYTRTRSLRASLRALDYCRTHADAISEQTPTTAQRIFTRVVYALVLINIIGTIYDVYTGDGNNRNKLLTAFSVPANWRRLTAVNQDGDPRLTAFIPMQGVRVIALGFTAYAHAWVFNFMFYTINPEALEEMTQKADGMFLSNGTSLIQAFLMISCFLTAYNLLIFSQKHELSLQLLPLCIIKRVIRITPVNLLIIGYGATWWSKIRDGPLVPATIGLESKTCINKFWTHVFYVNNIVDSTNYCITPTWFLPVDMHMYILACTLTLLLWRHRSTAIKLYTVLFFASSLLIAVVSYIKDFKPMIQMAMPEQIRRTFQDNPSYTEFYISSWGALPSCFLGLIFAHIQFELDERKIKLAEYKWFVYLHYAVFPLMFTWALTGIYARQYTSTVFYAAHIALDRSLFCIIIAITLMGLFHVDGPLRRFFSWRGWQIMARMSLTVMLLHWCVNIAIGARPVAYGTSLLDTLVDWIATHFITYMVAVPVTVLVEIPMQKFLTALIF